jgi:RHS repeat-associated protein
LVLSSFAIQSQAYYHPDEGRWLSRDPIGEDPHVLLVSPSEIQNLYLFVRNNAIINHDELGLSCCGPDVTERMKGEIRRLRGYFGRSPALPPTATRPARIVNATKKLVWFGRVALTLNYASQDLKYDDFVPTMPNCKETVTLCGKCVGDDLPGNILFGLSAQLAGISQTVRNRGANAAELLTDLDSELVEPPADIASFDIGASIGTSGSDDICSVAGSIPSSKLGPAECRAVVSTPRNFTPATLHTISYPGYISRIWPW